MSADESQLPSRIEEAQVSQVDLVVGDVSWGTRVGLASVLLVITLLVLLGIFHVARGAPMRGVVVEKTEDLPSPDDHLQFARSIQLLSNANLQPGNTVEILLNGNGTFPRMWRDIDSAKSSVTVQMYYSTPGRLVDSLAKHLAGRARSGVRVLVLLDAFGSRRLQRGWYDSLRAAGVLIAHLRPLQWYKIDRVSHRSHVRSLVVDGEVGYTGGYGFGDFWLGDAVSPDEWRETNVRVTGPVVLQLQATFMAGWVEATGELLPGTSFFPAEVRVTGETVAGLFTFFPTTGSSSAERFLALSIAAARRTLYIANSYFLPDARFRRMLADAVRRGVDVRVLTAGENTDVPLTRMGSRATYEPLLEAGVRIYEYRRTMMHAKTFVIDGQWVSIGSLNIDNRSMAYNDESNVSILDANIGAVMDSLFVQDLSRSDEILLADFRRRSLWERFLESAMNLFSGIL